MKMKHKNVITITFIIYFIIYIRCSVKLPLELEVRDQTTSQFCTFHSKIQITINFILTTFKRFGRHVIIGWARESEPTGRHLHQRSTAAATHSNSNRRDGFGRSAPVRHLPAAPRVSRMCLQNSQQISGSY